MKVNLGKRPKRMIDSIVARKPTMEQFKPELMYRIGETDIDYHGLSLCLRIVDCIDQVYSPKTVLLISDKYAIGSDGARIHAYKTKKHMEPGVYKADLCEERILLHKIEFEYPNFSELLETPINVGSKEFNLSGDSIMTFYSKLIRMLPDDYCINFDFIKSLPHDIYHVYRRDIDKDQYGLLLIGSTLTVFILSMVMYSSIEDNPDDCNKIPFSRKDIIKWMGKDDTKCSIGFILPID